MAIIAITGYEKKGPMLTYFTNDAKERCYRIDFEKGKIYGISGKILQSTISLISKAPNHNDAFYQVLYPLASFNNDKIFDNIRIKYFHIIESLLSYPDLWQDGVSISMIKRIVHEHNGEIPKGYIKWCRDNNEFFSFFSLKRFSSYIKIYQWPASLVKEVQQFCDTFHVDLLRMTDYNQELTTLLLKLIKNQIKKGGTLPYDIIILCYEITNTLKENPELKQYIDKNKTLSTVSSTLKNIIDKEKISKILQNEAKIVCLHGTIVEDYMIKIPLTMNDFLDEGEQQHNCVGHYYHDSIAKGTDLIYFLRKKNIPDKSYITCRFKIESNCTIEHRLKNNAYYCYPKLFEKIDALIREALATNN